MRAKKLPLLHRSRSPAASIGFVKAVPKKEGVPLALSGGVWERGQSGAQLVVRCRTFPQTLVLSCVLASGSTRAAERIVGVEAPTRAVAGNCDEAVNLVMGKIVTATSAGAPSKRLCAAVLCF